MRGFTLIELTIVIIILALLSVAVAPRFIDFKSDARVASLNGIASQFEATIIMAQSKARVSGLNPAAENPSGANGNEQQAYIVDFGFGQTEVDWRNLCPESEAELGDQLQMVDFIDVSGDDIKRRITNQHTLIGFQLPASGTPTNEGCYVLYDSFGEPDCTVQVVTEDC